MQAIFDPNAITISGQNPYDLILPSMDDEVKGEMLLIEQNIPANQSIKLSDTSYVEGLKKQIVNELVEKILKHHLVEFTKQEDLKTGDFTIRARAYLVPDDVVRTLKRNGY